MSRPLRTPTDCSCRNSSTWTRDLAGDWNYNGTPEVEQTGTTLTFINEHGGESDGIFVDIDTVEATDWGNLQADIAPGLIDFSGTRWTRTEDTPAVSERRTIEPEVDYTYDLFDRLIAKDVDEDGTVDLLPVYVYDGGNRIDVFDRRGP